MKIIDKCIKCGTIFIFTKKDIRALTKEEKIGLEVDNNYWKSLLDEKETVGLFNNRKVYVATGSLRKNIKKKIKNPAGIIKCPICDNIQFVLK